MEGLSHWTGWWHWVTWDGMMGCPAGPHPRCVVAGISPVPVEGLITDMDKHGLLDGPSDAMCLPSYNGEAVHIDGCPVAWLCW